MSQKKPKGRMSAYTFFVQTCRDEHRRWYPDENVNFTEFSKKCSARWKLMTEEQKSRFIEMSNDDKQRYESEMAKYSSQSGESRKRKKRDPLAPKRPLSAFFLFCQEERPKVREEHPSASISEIAKIMGERWSKIEPERKKIYEEDAVRAKANYDREAAAYREKTAKQQAAAVANTKRVANQQHHVNMVMQHMNSNNGQSQPIQMNDSNMDYCNQQPSSRMNTYQQMMLLNNQQQSIRTNNQPQMMMTDHHMYHLNSQQMMHHHLLNQQNNQTMVQLVPSQQMTNNSQVGNDQFLPPSPNNTVNSDHISTNNSNNVG